MYINVKWNSKRATHKVTIYQGHEYLCSQKSVGVGKQGTHYTSRADLCNLPLTRDCQHTHAHVHRKRKSTNAFARKNMQKEKHISPFLLIPVLSKSFEKSESINTSGLIPEKWPKSFASS